MCYEFWRNEKTGAGQVARQKAAELIDKARSAKPAAPAGREAPADVRQEPEQETVPA